MANRLAHETSPYLLQHAHNPVDWYPWGPEALEKSRAENKPILLSIGYAACHWCHVMAHESFEDESTAALMNKLFVNIKVDREERPDLDGIYMQAVQALTGSGGWPMTVFLMPSGEPFYGGTYFPPDERRGLPSFTRILNAVNDVYRNRPEAVEGTTRQLRQIFDRSRQRAKSEGALTPHALDLAYRHLAQKFDVRNAGFEGAPKFPPTMSLDFLLRYWSRTGTEYALEMAASSFRAMARGGIYDQVGGGFHRYTIDAGWQVPHFEKMLYDNALLIRLGAHLWQAMHDEEFKRVTLETAKWVEYEMTSPQGGFYSSLDADSDGEEGKFYIWPLTELDHLLGNDSKIVKLYYGVTPGGNFEGANILHVRTDPKMAATRAGISVELLDKILFDAKETLYEVRSTRARPGRDDKILAAWNGLMLRGIATAARAFRDQDLKRLALKNGAFLLKEMVQRGRVIRSHGTKIGGFLDDHAAVALGFISLYELTFDASWIAHAERIARSMIEWFWDDEIGAFFDSARDAEQLITRPRDTTDNAMPSGNSLAVDLLFSLAELLGDDELRQRATFVLESSGTALMLHPNSFGHLLGTADMALNGAVEVAIAGHPGDRKFVALAHEVSTHYLPSLVLAGGDNHSSPHIALMKGRSVASGKAAAYVCRAYTCDEPATDPSVLARQLSVAGKVASSS
ncbi:MAG: thioredoxin domain-containing protein [Gemmatimonadales bacterium]